MNKDFLHPAMTVMKDGHPCTVDAFDHDGAEVDCRKCNAGKEAERTLQQLWNEVLAGTGYPAVSDEQSVQGCHAPVRL